MAKKKQDYPADFLAFYQAYPKERHQGYVAPFKCWSSLEKKGELPELSVIIKAIEEQKTTRSWLSGYIPMMTTWLNQKRWEAEVQDNSLVKEQAAKAKQQKVVAFCDTQAEVITEWHERLVQRAAYYKYNLLKLAPFCGTYLQPVVDNLVFNNITLYIPEPESPVSIPCAILDAFCDLMNLRCKGVDWTEEAVTAICREYPNTVLMLVCGRYCDSLGIDSLPGCVTITPNESMNLRKLLTRMLDPEVCSLYRERYGHKAFFAPDTWLNAFTPDAILENFQEVVEQMDFKITDVPVDTIIGSDILTNAITSTEYLRRFVTIPHWKGLMPVEWADIVLSACVLYFNKYKEAPKKQYILDYLNSNQKVFKFRDDTLPSLISFLEGIPDDRSINPDFEIENTLQFLKKRALQQTKERLDIALDADDVELAEQAVTGTHLASVGGVEELDVLDMASTLQEATAISEDPLITMGGAFGELICPHIKRGSFVFFLATAKAGKTWCLYTLSSMAYNSGKNVLVFAAGDMDKNDNSIRIGHIMSRGDTASDPHHTGIYAFPVLDCMYNQDQKCDQSSNNVALPDYIERLMHSEDNPEKLLATMPPNYSPCNKCRTCAKWVPTWYYEPHDVQYKGWQGLNTHKEISKRRNGSIKFRIKVYPNNTLTTKEIEKQIAHCAEIEGWVPDLVAIDYADIMAWEEGDNERDARHRENTRWKNLRRLSQTNYRPCIITVTQSNRAGYSATSLDATNVNEDRRKLDHATAVFSLNQTDLEKDFRIARAACIMARGKSVSKAKEVVIMQGYEAGKFIRNSFWRKRIEQKAAK